MKKQFLINIFLALLATTLCGQGQSTGALAAALGLTNVVWVNTNQPSWFVETTNTQDGAAAAIGPLAYQKTGALRTTVTGPGSLEFWCAESLNTALTLLVDGVPKGVGQHYSGTFWTHSTFYLEPVPVERSVAELGRDRRGFDLKPRE